MLRLLATRPALWAVLAAPALWLLGRWAIGALTYGEVVTGTGIWAALLLIPAAAVTPLRYLFPGRSWLAWLIEHRGNLGAASLAYALAHAGAYGIGRGDLGLVLREAGQGWLLAGWAALLIFLLFAATTEDAAVRVLRRSWRWLHGFDRASAALAVAHRALKKFHRVVYIGAALVFLHWLLSAFDPLTVQVQAALHAYGYYYGPVDGIIGPDSRLALQRFQANYGLPVTGTITPEVLGKLGIVPN
jgi:sulfoxide reductase heme-binding subunit YedZ